jgi:hypothetical protein
MIESIEVVFIVVAMGSAGSGLLILASLGAVTAFLLVVALGLVLHRPVATIPENTLKLIVGPLRYSFGPFWIGEGMGFVWPGRDWAIAALSAGFPAASIVLVQLCRTRSLHTGALTEPGLSEANMNRIKTIWDEFIGLFVDDGNFAVAVLAWPGACWLLLPRLGLPSAWSPMFLFVGLVLVLAESAMRRACVDD